MNKEELLRRLEERLARGEIGERTYLDIKGRYDAMPEATIPPVPPEEPHYDSHRKFRNGDLESMIEQTIESAMEQVAASLDLAFANKDEARRQMGEVNRRIQDAMSKVGPRIEEDGRVCVIRGSGSVPGGQHFEEFKCAGSGTVAGDLLADEVHVSGACVIEGRCVGEEFHASGRAEIGKDVEVHEFHVSGKASVGGDVRAQEVSISGSAKIAGGIEAQEINLAGAAVIGGRVKTREFTSRGRFEIGDGIEAEEVDIRLSGTSKVPTIRAREIEIRRGDRHGDLVARTIEGEEVYLEATRAGLVRGKSVHLGPYCTVRTVEAQELELHETSTFQERRALSPG